MTTIKAYKFSHPIIGNIALIFIVGYKNPGGYLKGESHVIFSDCGNQNQSDSIRFEQTPHNDGPMHVTEDVMADLALDQAKLRIKNFVETLPELRRQFFEAASVSLADSQDLFHAWVRQKFPQMHQISFQSESEELREFIQSFTKYSTINVSEL